MLKIENVSKSMNGNRVINNVNLELDSGQIVSLIGPNGAGKTTLLNLISNILSTTQGSIKFIDDRKTAAYMQDSSLLYPGLTGYQHFEFIAGVNGKGKKEIEEIINNLEMKKYIKDKVKTYSLGMKQHLMLGIALLTTSNILLLDEPLNGLDPNAVGRFRDILMCKKREGALVLMSSHNLDIVSKLSDRILFIKNGEIIHTTSNEKNGNNAYYEIKFSKPIDPNFVQSLKENGYEVVEVVSEDTLRINFGSRSTNDLFKFIISSENEVEILTVNKDDGPSLEELFNTIFGGTK